MKYNDCIVDDRYRKLEEYVLKPPLQSNNTELNKTTERTEISKRKKSTMYHNNEDKS